MTHTTLTYARSSAYGQMTHANTACSPRQASSRWSTSSPRNLWNDYIAGRLPAVRPRRRRHGPDHLDNFAWSCPFCNRAKGGRVAQGRTRFFDPRHDRWPRHFMFPPATGYIVIAGATPVGHASAGPSGLDFNAGGLEGSLVTRHLAIQAGAYPPPWARSAYSL